MHYLFILGITSDLQRKRSCSLSFRRLIITLYSATYLRITATGRDCAAGTQQQRYALQSSNRDVE